MKVTNIVVSTVAALSMASVLGIAYAQSTYSDPQTGTTNQGASGSMNQQDATGNTTQGSSTTRQGSTNMDSNSNMGSNRNMDSTSTTRSDPMYNERVARADRN